MSIPSEALDELMNRCNIVDIVSSYIVLKQRGQSYTGLCPFHRERTPSFSVSADKQLFHCFGCGVSGNVFGFIMKIENLSFMDAVRHLANLIHFTLPEGKLSDFDRKRKALKERLYELNKTAARFFFDCLWSSEGAMALAYLNDRGVAVTSRKRFGLGVSPDKKDALYQFLLNKGYDDNTIKTSGLVIYDSGIRDKFINRLMFPIFSPTGQITGFGGRILGEGAVKYLNSPETPVFNKSDNLYGINFARKSKARQFLIAEGYMDVIALHQAGFTGAVAALGTAFNQKHASLLKRYTSAAILVFDSDEAGVKAAQNAIRILEGASVSCKVLTLKGAKDPDEFLKSRGKDAFARALGEAPGSVPFQINTIKERFDIEKPEEKAAFVSEAIRFLSTIDLSAERGVYASDLSKMAGIPIDAVMTQLNRLLETPSGEITPPIYRRRFDANIPKGIMDAQKSIIVLALSSPAIAAALEDTLKPEYMLNKTYAKLLSIIYEQKKTAAGVNPAALINRFEDMDEHKTAADVFMTAPPNETDDAALNAILTQLVRRILEYYYTMRLHTPEVGQNIERVNEILKDKKNLKKINITVVDFQD